MTLMSLRTLTASAAVLALSTGFAAAAPAVVQNDLNLRSGPGTDYDVIAAMPAGSTVNVLGCQGGWCQVAFGGTAGFASRSYLGIGGVAMRGPVYGAPVYGADEGYDEGYVVGGYQPGYDEGYVSGGYGRGFAYRDNGYEGERSFGSVRESRDTGFVGTDRDVRRGEFRGERRGEISGDIRGERRDEVSGERRGEFRGERRGTQSAARIEGNERTTNARGAASTPTTRTSASTSTSRTSNLRGEEVRGREGASAGTNANATTGAGPRENSNDNHGPNFIGGEKKFRDNHP